MYTLRWNQELVVEMEAEITPGPFEITITAFRCRCGYEWAHRELRNTERPRVCPSCKSANWDRPKRWSRKGKEDD